MRVCTGVYAATPSINTNPDIRAEHLRRAGTAQSRIVRVPHNALLLLRAESYLCVPSSVASLLLAALNLAKTPSFPSTHSGCMAPCHSTRFLAASERVGGRRTRKWRHPSQEGVGPSRTWHRAGRVHAYRSWAPHGSTMRTWSRSTRFPVRCICIRSCVCHRFTFRGSRAFSRTRRCRDPRFSGSLTRAKVGTPRTCRVEFGLSDCLSPRSGCRQMSRLPWPDSSDRGKALSIRLLGNGKRSTCCLPCYSRAESRSSCLYNPADLLTQSYFDVVSNTRCSK